jgi:hypothetical protein
MALAHCSAAGLHLLANEWESGGEVAHRYVHRPQIVQALGIERVVFSERLTSQVSGLSRSDDRLLIASLLMELPDPLKKPSDLLSEVV